MAAGHYMLSGDFFENYQKFEGFFEILEDPKQFERYKRLIINRKEFVQPSCNSRWEEVFRDMVERDAERNAAFALGSLALRFWHMRKTSANDVAPMAA